MAAGAVTLKFLGDTASLEGSFKRVQGESTKTQGVFGTLKQHAKLVAAAMVGLGVEIGKGAVDEALKAQTAQTALTQAMKNAGVATSDGAVKMKEYADAQIKRGFSDVQVTQSLSRLVVATHNVAGATKLNSVAEDLARTKSISLASATDMLIRLHAGNTRALKGLGIVLNPVTTAVDKLKATTKKYTPEQLAAAKATDKQTTAQKGLVALMKATHGQADQFAKTDAGKIQIFHASWEHLQVELGNVLIPVLGKVMSVVNSLMAFIDQHKKVVEALALAVGGLAVAVVSVHKAISIWNSVTSAASAISKLFVTTTAAAATATEGETVAQEGLNTAMRANPIGIVVTALAALVTGFMLAWQNSQTFRDIVKGALDVVKTIAIDVANFFTNDVPAAFNAVLSWLRGNWQAIATIISGPFAPLVALATNAFGVRTALVDAFNAVKGAIGTVVGAIVDFFINLPGRVGNAIADGVKGLVGAASSFAQRVADAFMAPFRSIYSAVAGVLSSIAGLFASNNAAAQQWLQNLQATTNAAAGTVRFGTTTYAAPATAKHALGGIFTQPHFGMVAEAGPEAIIPLSKPNRAAQVMAQAGLWGGRGSSSGRTVNITVNSPSLNPADLAMTVVQAISVYEQRNGRRFVRA